MTPPISPSRKALRIALSYAIAAVLWITLTDIFTDTFAQIPELFLQISLYKGWTFVGVTTVLLFVFLRQDFEKSQKTMTQAKQNEQLLKDVLETLPVGIWLLDADGKIYQSNSEGIRIWGGMRTVGIENFDIFRGWRLTRDELIMAKDWGGAKAVLDGSSTLNEELRIEGFDGEFRYILHSAVPLRNDQGAISGAVVVNQDITEQKLAETSFKTTEDLLSKILENAPTPIFVTCEDGRIRLVNRAWAEAVRVSPSKVVGLYVDQVFPTEVAKQYLENNRQVLESQKVLKAEESLECEDGWHIFEVVKFPVFDAAEMKMATAGISIDITERKKLQEELETYHKSLTALASDLTLAEERERRKIAVGLHDEIGQPLALAQIRLGQIIADERRGNIVSGANEVRSLIDEIIQKARTLTFELSPPILYELGLEAALRSLAESFSAKHGILVGFEKGNGANQLDENLKVLLYLAVRELLVNIVKHAEATKVNICLKGDGKILQLIVEDNGVGFTQQQTERQGFGLFSIRERIKNYGGKLDIQPLSDHGVRCLISVPIVTTGLTEE